MMAANRYQIINQLRNYFSIQEIVDDPVFSMFGQRAWRFFDTDALHCLLVVRRELDKPITVNNWMWGGSFDERGLRHNRSDMVIRKDRPYLSAHLMGKAFDFDVKGMKANDVRKWILDHEHLFPCKIRLENRLNGKHISWVHLDTVDEKTNPKVYIFDV